MIYGLASKNRSDSKMTNRFVSDKPEADSLFYILFRLAHIFFRLFLSSGKCSYYLMLYNNWNMKKMKILSRSKFGGMKIIAGENIITHQSNSTIRKEKREAEKNVRKNAVC